VSDTESSCRFQTRTAWGIQQGSKTRAATRVHSLNKAVKNTFGSPLIPLEIRPWVIHEVLRTYIHSNGFTLKLFSHLRLWKQRWIYFNLESPVVTAQWLWDRDLTDFLRRSPFFNWTMTYALDSDVPSPHGPPWGHMVFEDGLDLPKVRRSKG
jgi:hypothetical protein